MGGKILAEKTGCTYLGSVPIDPNLTVCIENGLNFLETLKDSTSYLQAKVISDTLIQ